MAGHGEDDGSVLIAWFLAVVTLAAIAVLWFLSATALRGLCRRFKGCRRHHGSYDLMLVEPLIDTPVNGMPTDLAPESVSYFQTRLRLAMLDSDITDRVHGFQCLSEATVLVPMSNTLAHKYHTYHRVAAGVLCFLLPVNLIVFEFCSKNFECVSEHIMELLPSCLEYNPREPTAANIAQRIWECVGLLLPGVLLMVFYLVQDENLQVANGEGQDDGPETVAYEAVPADAAGAPEGAGKVPELYHAQEQSYVLRILSLAHQKDKMILARSMDKWASITLIAIAVVFVLTAISCGFELLKTVENGASVGQFAETVVLVLVIQLQSLYVSAMMVTILLHLRTFRKVLLLDVRRAFISVTESSVFRWMKRGNNGNNPLKQYAEDFMPNVLDPFATSMQWMLWLAFFSVILILLNVMVQTLTPFKQAHEVGEYVSGFYISIGIVIFFAYKVYQNLQLAIDNAFQCESLDVLKGANGVEPLLLIGEAMGFKHGEYVRQAVGMYTQSKGSIKDAIRDANEIRSGREGLRLASKVGGIIVETNPERFATGKASVLKYGAQAASGQLQTDILAALSNQDAVAAKLMQVPGISNAETAARLASLAAELGVQELNGANRLEQLLEMQRQIQQLDDIRSAMHAQTGPQKTATAFAAITELVAVWADFQSVADASVVAEFSSVVLPKFQEQTIDAEQVAAFLRERLQTNDLVVDGISRALSLVQRTDRE